MNVTTFVNCILNMIHRILIIQTASIGDVILMTPIIEKIHKFHPKAKIDVLIKKGFEDIFEGHPFLNYLWLWDKKQHKYRNLFKLAKEIRKVRYDAVINVQRFISTGFITLFSGATQRVGFDKNPLSVFYTKRIPHKIGKTNKKVHEIDRNLSLIHHLSDDQKQNPKLYPSLKDKAKVSPYKTNAYICIAPASLWFTKQYPEEKWIEFMNHIPDHFHVYLIGSKTDQSLCQRIIETTTHINCINLAGKFSLLESTALMRDAVMNYVNDSAPMHLCSAINAKTTVIYCSTVPRFGFGPLSEDSVVVETDVQLDCRPCGLHGYKSCPKSHFKCATTIQKEKLLNRL